MRLAATHGTRPVVAQRKPRPACRHTHLDLGMLAIEFRQARDQPVHCKSGRDPNREHRTRPHRRNLLRKSLDRVNASVSPGWNARPWSVSSSPLA